jgi:phosphatidylserine decarboxylase
VKGVALQAKGITYSIADLLRSEERARDFSSGVFLTLYLSPRHYHRIHSPLSGGLFEAVALPGRLLPVNLPAVRSIADLFPRNERLVAWIAGEGIRAAVVAVGAFNVGRISAPFDPEWGGSAEASVTNLRGRPSPERRTYTPALPIQRGEEIMAFHLGSTVVLLLGSDEGELVLDPALREGAEIPLGSPLLAGRPKQTGSASGAA